MMSGCFDPQGTPVNPAAQAQAQAPGDAPQPAAGAVAPSASAASAATSAAPPGAGAQAGQYHTTSDLLVVPRAVDTGLGILLTPPDDRLRERFSRLFNPPNGHSIIHYFARVNKLGGWKKQQRVLFVTNHAVYLADTKTPPITKRCIPVKDIEQVLFSLASNTVALRVPAAGQHDVLVEILPGSSSDASAEVRYLLNILQVVYQHQAQASYPVVNHWVVEENGPRRKATDFARPLNMVKPKEPAPLLSIASVTHEQVRLLVAQQQRAEHPAPLPDIPSLLSRPTVRTAASVRGLSPPPRTALPTPPQQLHERRQRAESPLAAAEADAEAELVIAHNHPLLKRFTTDVTVEPLPLPVIRASSPARSSPPQQQQQHPQQRVVDSTTQFEPAPRGTSGGSAKHAEEDSDEDEDSEDEEYTADQCPPSQSSRHTQPPPPMAKPAAPAAHRQQQPPLPRGGATTITRYPGQVHLPAAPSAAASDDGDSNADGDIDAAAAAQRQPSPSSRALDFNNLLAPSWEYQRSRASGRTGSPPVSSRPHHHHNPIPAVAPAPAAVPQPPPPPPQSLPQPPPPQPQPQPGAGLLPQALNFNQTAVSLAPPDASMISVGGSSFMHYQPPAPPPASEKHALRQPPPPPTLPGPGHGAAVGSTAVVELIRKEYDTLLAGKDAVIDELRRQVRDSELAETAAAVSVAAPPRQAAASATGTAAAGGATVELSLQDLLSKVDGGSLLAPTPGVRLRKGFRDITEPVESSMSPPRKASASGATTAATTAAAAATEDEGEAGGNGSPAASPVSALDVELLAKEKAESIARRREMIAELQHDLAEMVSSGRYDERSPEVVELRQQMHAFVKDLSYEAKGFELEVLLRHEKESRGVGGVDDDDCDSPGGAHDDSSALALHHMPAPLQHYAPSYGRQDSRSATPRRVGRSASRSNTPRRQSSRSRSASAGAAARSQAAAAAAAAAAAGGGGAPMPWGGMPGAAHQQQAHMQQYQQYLQQQQQPQQQQQGYPVDTQEYYTQYYRYMQEYYAWYQQQQQQQGWPEGQYPATGVGGVNTVYPLAAVGITQPTSPRRGAHVPHTPTARGAGRASSRSPPPAGGGGGGGGPTTHYAFGRRTASPFASRHASRSGGGGRATPRASTPVRGRSKGPSRVFGGGVEYRTASPSLSSHNPALIGRHW